LNDLILTHQQARLLAEASLPVPIRDPEGNLLGYASPNAGKLAQHGFTPAQLAEAKRRADSDGPWYTTQQVLDHLRSLEQAC
jgi:hypothetical protein